MAQKFCLKNFWILNIQNSGKKLQFLSTGQRKKNVNFLNLLHGENLNIHWLSVEKSQILFMRLRKITNLIEKAQKLQILLMRCGKIVNFVDCAQKNHKFCQSSTEKLQILVIEYEKINFVKDENLQVLQIDCKKS